MHVWLKDIQDIVCIADDISIHESTRLTYLLESARCNVHIVCECNSAFHKQSMADFLVQSHSICWSLTYDNPINKGKLLMDHLVGHHPQYIPSSPFSWSKLFFYMIVSFFLSNISRDSPCNPFFCTPHMLQQEMKSLNTCFTNKTLIMI